MTAINPGFRGFPKPTTRTGLPDMVWLAQRKAANVAVLDFTEFDPLYDAYAFEFLNLLPVNNSETLLLRFSVDGGATYDAGVSYQYTNAGRNQGGSDTSATSAGATSLRLTGTDGISNVAADGGVNGRLRLFGTNTNARRHVLFDLSHYHTANGYEFIVGGGMYVAGPPVNGARFFMVGSNAFSGSIQMYGLRKYA